MKKSSLVSSDFGGVRRDRSARAALGVLSHEGILVPDQGL